MSIPSVVRSDVDFVNSPTTLTGRLYESGRRHLVRLQKDVDRNHSKVQGSFVALSALTTICGVIEAAVSSIFLCLGSIALALTSGRSKEVKQFTASALAYTTDAVARSIISVKILTRKDVPTYHSVVTFESYLIRFLSEKVANQLIFKVSPNTNEIFKKWCDRDIDLILHYSGSALLEDFDNSVLGVFSAAFRLPQSNLDTVRSIVQFFGGTKGDVNHYQELMNPNSWGRR